MELPKIQQIPAFRQVVFHGQRVTVERTSESPTGFVATGWEKGLPVTRRPIDGWAIMGLLKRYPHTLR